MTRTRSPSPPIPPWFFLFSAVGRKFLLNFYWCERTFLPFLEKNEREEGKSKNPALNCLIRELASENNLLNFSGVSVTLTPCAAGNYFYAFVLSFRLQQLWSLTWARVNSSHPKTFDARIVQWDSNAVNKNLRRFQGSFYATQECVVISNSTQILKKFVSPLRYKGMP